jgi:hypothetical protein
MRTSYLLAVVACCLSLRAPGAQEAIPSINLYTADTGTTPLNSAGFEFTPATNLLVTSLGFGGRDITTQPYQVFITGLGGPELTSAVVSTNSTFLNQSYYSPVTSITLWAGTTYYVGATGANNSYYSGDVLIAPPDAEPNGTFTVSPYLSYLGAAWQTNALITSLPELEPVNDLLIGPNFQFTLVPEPAAGLLGIAAMGGMTWCRRRSRR